MSRVPESERRGRNVQAARERKELHEEKFSEYEIPI